MNCHGRCGKINRLEFPCPTGMDLLTPNVKTFTLRLFLILAPFSPSPVHANHAAEL